MQSQTMSVAKAQFCKHLGTLARVPSIHPHVDKKGDNDGNNEYRCPHCNRLDFRSEAKRDAHAAQCDRRETRMLRYGIGGQQRASYDVETRRHQGYTPHGGGSTPQIRDFFSDDD